MHRLVTSDGCLGGGKLDAPRVNGGDGRGLALAAPAALATPAAPAALAIPAALAATATPAALAATAAAVATPSALSDREELVRGHGHLWKGGRRSEHLHAADWAEAVVVSTCMQQIGRRPRTSAV